MNFLFFAFKNNISSKVLNELGLKGDKFIINGIEDINYLVEFIQCNKIDRILGLDEYSRRDKNKLRVELKCTNKFRNSSIGKQNLIELEINNFLKLTNNSKFSYKQGNSYCNLISYKIINEIKKMLE